MNIYPPYQYAQSALRSNLDREREKKYIHTINYIYQRCCINKQEDTDGFNSVEWLYQNNNYSDFIKAWCVKITLSKKTLIGHLINWQEIKKKVTKKIHNESHLSCVLFFYACKLCIACIIYKILFFTSFLFSFFFYGCPQFSTTVCSPSVWLISAISFIKNVLFIGILIICIIKYMIF